MNIFVGKHCFPVDHFYRFPNIFIIVFFCNPRLTFDMVEQCDGHILGKVMDELHY